MTRHEFLRRLHALLVPKTYLEVGVQRGHSLRLAAAAERAIGIDPRPLGEAYSLCPWAQIYPTTSDEFFSTVVPPPIDLAFIDGMHLYEFALRDFANIERYAAPGAVVVFDDVLPRNEAEASRESNPGDWAGDVWKVPLILGLHRPDLRLTLVDVQPTGVLVVEDLCAGTFAPLDPPIVPHDGSIGVLGIFNRSDAIDAETALKRIEAHRT